MEKQMFELLVKGISNRNPITGLVYPNREQTVIVRAKNIEDAKVIAKQKLGWRGQVCEFYYNGSKV